MTKLKLAAVSKFKKNRIIFLMGLALLVPFLFFVEKHLNLNQQSVGEPSVNTKNGFTEKKHKNQKTAENNFSEGLLAKPSQEKFSREQVVEIIRQDDICNVFSPRYEEKSKLDNYSILGGEGLIDLLEGINTGHFEKALDANMNPNVEKFLKAIIFSGMIYSDKEVVPDYKKADLAWEELINNDWDNAYVFFFYLGYLEKRGAKTAVKEKFFREMLEKSFYQDRYLEATKYIFNKGLGGPVRWLMSVGIISTLPFPNYLLSLRASKNVLENSSDEVLKKKFDEFALSRVELPQKLQGRLEMIEWSAVEYKVFSGLLKNRGIKTKDLGDLRKDDNGADQWHDFVVQAVEDIKNSKSCNPERIKLAAELEANLFTQLRRNESRTKVQ